METDKVIVKYSSYTDAQKRATQKYRQNNKDKVNDQRKQYYLSRKEKDPEFLNYKRQKAKEYYLRKKEARLMQDLPDVEPLNIIVEANPLPLDIIIPQSSPPQEDTPIIPPRKKKELNSKSK
jgi:hypothetical protein